ncbi:MAG: altronate dehydratase family protein [Oscillospiraceae bacterium]|nr:altronate dehydratase family protein [Oscillospiraceae bacterium]
MSFLKINPADNVAVALKDVKKGEQVSVGDAGLTALTDIAQGHKAALAEIKRGSEVVKYGCPIGIATADIHPGEHVHTHNLKTRLSEKERYVYTPNNPKLPPVKPDTFMGFVRQNGKVGIRNEVWVVPTVGCINSIAGAAAGRAQAFIKGSVQGVYAFPRPYGCSQLGGDLENTQKALSGLVRHPNAGGVLVLGLGCENNRIEDLRKVLGPVDEARIKFLNVQELEDDIGDAAEILRELIDLAAVDTRSPVPTSELILGLKCGGSDGLSGVTANPLAGVLSDKLIAGGGSAILTEVPEMFGAETILMNRCKDQATFLKTVALVNNFKDYFISNNQPIYENPSPGNKDGGITTLEDKSLGCTQKCGAAPVVDVLDYGCPLTQKGLNLLNSPGNDLVAVSALAVSGAHLVIFTTGRGTPFGSPVPTVKVSSNTPLAQRKKNWIDFDAGRLVDGHDLEALGQELYRYVVALASGQVQTNSEKYGIREFVIFKSGVTL